MCTARKGRELAKKSAKRRAWTAGEVRELRALVRQKTPVAKIARVLKRSQAATRHKLSVLGLSLRSRRAKIK